MQMDLKRILVLNLFPTAKPPVTGGQIRYFHIYDKLSQYYDITLLSQSGRRETVIYSPVFATSEQEKASFIAMYKLNSKKVKLAPNGINADEWLKRNHSREHSNDAVKALFIGANYRPNIEAVKYIINHLADKCAEVQFLIAGACCNSFPNLKKPNIKLLGRVNHAIKLKLFANADIAVNPIFSGGGVNIKTLEFLSAGIPLFSTGFGARGLNLIDKKHYIKAEMKDFADKINEVCHLKKKLEEIALNGQKYINENYSWNSIAKNINKEIDIL